MNHKYPLHLSAILAGVLMTISGVVQAETTLGSEEITALFSDKTVSYHFEKKGYDATIYYSPDGAMRGVKDGKSMNGKWEVNGRGELCIKEGMSNNCRTIVENNGVYKKIKIKHNGNEVHVITYKSFIDGNPNNY